MEYPKYPFGRSSPGAALSRALEGESFQRKQGISYQAHKKGGGFVRVETKDPAYVTVGTVRPFGGTHAPSTRYYESIDFTQNFTPSWRLAGINCGSGIQAVGSGIGTASATTSYAYKDYISIDTRNASFGHFDGVELMWVSASYGSAPAGLGFVAGVPPWNGWAWTYPTYTPHAYMGFTKVGTPPTPHRTVIAAFLWTATSPYDFDSVGRPGYMPYVAYFTTLSADPTPIPLEAATEFKDYHPPQAPIVSRNFIRVIVAERMNCDGARDITKKVFPAPVWLFTSTDRGATWSKVDISDTYVGDFDKMPHVVWQGSSNTVPGGSLTTRALDVDGKPTIPAGVLNVTQWYEVFPSALSRGGSTVIPVNPYVKADFGWYNGNLSFSQSLAISVVIEADVVVIAYPYRKTVPAVTGTYKWVSRIIKIDGTTASVLYTSTDVTTTASYIQSMVFVGNHTLVAKRVSGFDGTNFDVMFMKSTDSGATWTDMTPTGFGCPSKNQYFGKLFVDRAYDATRTASPAPRLLINAWDTSRGAYFMYSSEDYGASWKRKGMIMKPDTFYRVDNMTSGDGGGQFENISITGMDAFLRTVDLAIPDRYKKASEI